MRSASRPHRRRVADMVLKAMYLTNLSMAELGHTQASGSDANWHHSHLLQTASSVSSNRTQVS